jgi:thiol-disulfide isomerase/thioredoxin
MKLILFLVLLLAPIACLSPQPDGGFIIKGQIKGLADQYLYYDGDFNSDKVTVKDSFLLKKERFTLTGKVSEPTKLDFYTKDFTTFNGSLILENAKIKYSVNLKKPSKEIVEGSFSNELNNRYQYTIGRCYQGCDCEINNQVQRHLLQNTLKLVKEYPEHPVTLMGITHLLKYLNTGYGSADLLNTIVQLLKPVFEDEPEYKSFKHFANACGLRQPGQYFIQYQAMLPNGERSRVSDYYGESYLFVNCWASWRGYCREEYKHYSEVYKTFRNKGFKIVSISFDHKQSSWIKAIDKDSMQEYINLCELKNRANNIGKIYGINQVPDNFLLDKSGKIIKNNVRAAELMGVMTELYNKDLIEIAGEQ